MELLHLKYFRTVARLEHMTRAAEELCIAQPALSRTIAHLERELGVALFDRRGKYIHLNQYGKAFLIRVDEALNALADGSRELREMSGGDFGDVKLAVLAASNLLPDLLGSFKKAHPNIRFSLIQHFSNLSKPDFDACISASTQRFKDRKSIPLLAEEIHLAVPNEHPLAHRKRIRLGEVAEDGFISLKSGQSLKEATDGFCRMAGFTPNVVFESDDPATVRGLIRAGLGVAFIPAVTWGGSEGASVTLLDIQDPRCERTISLSCAEDRNMSQAARVFRDFAVGYFEGLGEKG